MDTPKYPKLLKVGLLLAVAAGASAPLRGQTDAVPVVELSIKGLDQWSADRLVSLSAPAFVVKNGVKVPSTSLFSRVYTTHAGNWAGKRFSDILPPDKIKHIILTWAGGGPPDLKKLDAAAAAQLAQDYGKLFAALENSDGRAQDWKEGDGDTTAAEFVVLTTEGVPYGVSVIQKRGSTTGQAVELMEQGQHGARIDMPGLVLP